jgi:phosphoribosylaminoimidazole-succinocarboxamide synthase
MGIDLQLLQEQRRQTLESTDFPELGRLIRGKVRDSYVRDGQRIMIATDRLSCFDVVVGTIPFKGQVLNQLAAFWFEQTREIAPNHLVSVPDPVVSVVRECELIPVEFVYRAYLTGSSGTSIWFAYERGDREYCGHRLPDGMHKHEPLAEPLLTPTTKAEQGEHDEPISRQELVERGVLSEELYDRAAELTGRLFAAGRSWAESRGLILVDTKYELGLSSEGELVVIDEIHTPDSSRYWYRDTYDQAMSQGRDPQALDKEYVRRWLSSQGWRGDGPHPTLSDQVVCEAARRYIETFETVTGAGFEPSTDPPLERIRRNLAGFFAPNV